MDMILKKFDPVYVPRPYSPHYF